MLAGSDPVPAMADALRRLLDQARIQIFRGHGTMTIPRAYQTMKRASYSPKAAGISGISRMPPKSASGSSTSRTFASRDAESDRTQPKEPLPLRAM